MELGTAKEDQVLAEEKEKQALEKESEASALVMQLRRQVFQLKEREGLISPHISSYLLIPSMHRHYTVTAPSLYCHCTITVPPGITRTKSEASAGSALGSGGEGSSRGVKREREDDEVASGEGGGKRGSQELRAELEQVRSIAESRSQEVGCYDCLRVSFDLFYDYL